MKTNKSLILIFLVTSILNTFYIESAQEDHKSISVRFKGKFGKLKKEKLGEALFSILGVEAFATKEDAINAGVSFDKQNIFERKEIVVAKDYENNNYVYAVVLGCAQIPKEITEQFQNTYDVGWLLQGINSGYDIFSSINIGKIIQPTKLTIKIDR